MPWWFCRGPGDSWHLQSLLWQPTVVEGRITWCDHHDANIWCKHMMQYVKNVMFLFFSFDVWVLWILMQFLTSISFFYQQWIILVLTRIELRGGGQLGDELWPLSFCHQIQRPNYLKFSLKTLFLCQCQADHCRWLKPPAEGKREPPFNSHTLASRRISFSVPISQAPKSLVFKIFCSGVDYHYLAINMKDAYLLLQITDDISTCKNWYLYFAYL